MKLRTKSSRRFTIFFKSAMYSAVLAVVMLFGACSKETAQEQSNMAKYTANYNKWKMSATTNYTFTENRNCFCAGNTPYQVVVKNNMLFQATDSKGQVITPASSLAFPGLMTIDQLFDFVKTSLERNPARVDIVYNAQFGYPESFYFDFDLGVADEEIGYDITNFKKTL